MSAYSRIHDSMQGVIEYHTKNLKKTVGEDVEAVVVVNLGSWVNSSPKA